MAKVSGIEQYRITQTHFTGLVVECVATASHRREVEESIREVLATSLPDSMSFVFEFVDRISAPGAKVERYRSSVTRGAAMPVEGQLPNDPPPPAPQNVRAFIRKSMKACLGLPEADVQRAVIEEISSHLSGARVWRVSSSAMPSFSAVLKIPDWGTDTPLQGAGAVTTREWSLISSGLLDQIEQLGVHAPRRLGFERRDRRTCLWMEDIRAALAVPWRPPLALRAARDCARLHAFFRSAHQDLLELPWLGRDEAMFYSSYLEACHQNLTSLPQDPRYGSLFDADDIPALHRALDRQAWATRELQRLPPTFIHGDFHNRNIGFDARGMVVIDWAHAGIAPLGSDIACFTSVYRLFGGEGGTPENGFEDGMIDAYVDAIQAIEPYPGLRADVIHAVGLWHLTWGLHLRLGPGLTALLKNYIKDEEQRERAAIDIQEGCRRALRFLQQRA